MKQHKNSARSSVDIHLLELVRLRIGYINQCQYSIDLHFNELKNFGETDHRLSLVAVWDQVHEFSIKERAIFSLTDYVICPNRKFLSTEIQDLLIPHFNKEEISILSQAIRQIDLWTRSMNHHLLETNLKKRKEG